MGLFGGKGSGSDTAAGARTPRHSSGWAQMLKFLTTDESYRVLDFGPTSAGNINFVTSLGHSIYMANFVEDAARPEYLLPAEPGERPAIDTGKFLAENLDFSGRIFDVVLLWDTLDYLPKDLIQPIANRLYDVMSPGGQLLAFFHAGSAPGSIQRANAGTKGPNPEEAFTRYHLTNSDLVDLQRIGGKPILHTQTNRQVEAIFHRYSGYKFFLAKDNLREVIVTR
jgi:hypothetical protein